MKPITFDTVCYRVGGKPAYLHSGEFHYFRVPRADWRRRMRLLRRAGGNCLATYIPWLLHEPREGQFVFGGQDWLELEAFLDAAAAEGLYVLARPGPYQYSELVCDGLPRWLSADYPALRAKDIAGKDFRRNSISYLHPLFLAKARRWFDAVCPIIARHTVDRGGPVALVQVDNEMAGIHTWFGSMDYNAETMGFGRPEGRWPRWLAGRYASLAALNEQYGTSFDSWESVRPVPPSPTASLADLRRAKDYWDFYLDTVGEYAATLAGWVRGHGIGTPIVHNSASPTMNAWFLETIRRVRQAAGSFLLGSDHYYSLDQNWTQNNPTPQYAAGVFLSFEMLRLWGFPPTVFELPGGSLSDWPPVTPHDARACYMSNVALGMKGHNYYIFTGGPNAPGTGVTGELYDYGAGVGALGQVRPLYRVQRALGRFLAQRQWLVEAEGEPDFRIAACLAQSRCHNYWKDRGSFAVSGPEAWEFLRKGLLTTAFCASLSPALCDAESSGWTDDTATPVVVVASAAMSAAAQEYVVRFLRAGGRAIIAPTVPQFDEDFRPCTLLRDFLGTDAPRAIREELTRPTVAGVVNVWNNWRCLLACPPPAGAELLGTEELSGSPIAWEVPAGAGRAVFLGFRWYHARREHEAMLTGLLKRLGLKQRIVCSSPNVWCTLRTAGRRSVLFVMNLNSSPMAAAVACRPRWSRRMIDTGLHKLPAMTVKAVDLA